jgi:hypothetical protein
MARLLETCWGMHMVVKWRDQQIGEQHDPSTGHDPTFH